MRPIDDRELDSLSPEKMVDREDGVKNQQVKRYRDKGRRNDRDESQKNPIECEWA